MAKAKVKGMLEILSERFGGAPVKEPEKKDDGPSAADLLKRLDDLERTNADLRTAMLTQAPTAAPVVVTEPPKPAEVDLTGMPDPEEHPKDYAKELTKRVQSTVQANVAASTGAAAAAENERSRLVTESAKRTETLLAAFKSAHPEMAKDEKRLGYAAAKVMEGKAGMGIDMDKYMFGTSAVFIEDVAKEYGEIFPAEPTKAEAKKADTDDDDDTDDRTNGVFGGTESGGKPANTDDDDDKPGDMIKDFHDIQRTSGYY